MHLTPQVLVGCYDFLRITPPFAGWRLPEPDEVEFHVVRSIAGRCYADAVIVGPGGAPIVRVASSRVRHTLTLAMTMAHEMVHLYLDAKGVKSAHGREFRSCARLVCAQHGFDPGWF